MDFNSSIVMRPKLIRVGNACYRRLDCDDFDGIIEDLTMINPPTGAYSSSNRDRNQQKSTQNRYLIEDLERQDMAMDDEDFQLQLNEEEEFIQDNNGYTLKVHLCMSFFGYLIGKRGQTKMSIENETQTLIYIPKGGGGGGSSLNQKSNFIKISGAHQQNILKALKRIRDLEQSFRKKQKLTHFVSIPLSLLNSEIKKRFLEFKSLILSDPKCSVAKCIDETVFQSEHRLHLTINILYIGDNYESKLTKNYLDKFNTNFLQSFLKENLQNDEKIILHVKGIDIMNDDPSEANVLYAKVSEVSEKDLFRKIINELYDWFNDSGLVCESERADSSDSLWKVKIHATLMNTRYRNNNNSKSNFKMDVTNILEKFSDYDFGYLNWNQIHISTVDCYDEKNDNYYLPLAKIIF